MAENRASQAPKVPRGKWVAMLHRAPSRWDVLFHQFAEALARRYWYTQCSFSQSILKFDNDELWDVAIQMSRAFSRQTSYAGAAQLAGKTARPSIFTLQRDLDAVVRDGSKAIADALVNYVEVVHNCFMRRNHPDLQMVLPRLEETLRRFLLNKCTPDGELVGCIQSPAAGDEGYFPAGNRPADPAIGSGNPALDAYLLNVIVHDADDAPTIMRKLVDFVKSDPSLAPEFAVEMVAALAARRMRKPEDKSNDAIESIRARDRILFRPSRQAGKSPMQLFAEAQLMPSERQKQRLARWVNENVHGVFRIQTREGEMAHVIDLTGGSKYAVRGEGPLAESEDGTLVQMRIVPWDEHWRMTGVAHAMTTQSEAELEQTLHPVRLRRQSDNDDPRLMHAHELVAFVHDQFEAQFAGEVAIFDKLEECREAMAKFHRALMAEARLPDGRPFADAWRDDVRMEFPPFLQERFAAGETDVPSPGVMYDRIHGMAFLPFAQQAQLAVTSPFATLEQKQALTRLLLEKWRPGWILRRMANAHPERIQELLREILGDDSFDVARDLDALLGRVKCPDYTLPQRPIPFLMD